MTDSSVLVRQQSGGDRPIDVELVTNDLGDPVYRQRVSSSVAAERELTHVVATVTASGDTTVHTPASGKKVRLWWVYAIPDPDSSSNPLIKVSLGAAEKYRTFGAAVRQRATGAVNAAVVINLSEAGSVAFTALIEEVD